MKIFAIRDEMDKSKRDLAYLLYYETTKCFYIELPDETDSWEVPLILSSFARKGEHTVNSYWSRIWVQQRIIPPDRQNIGQVLRENGLKEYDEFALMMLSKGRCEQDDYYLVPINESCLSEDVLKRFSRKVEDVVPLENNCLLVFFRDGTVRKCDLTAYLEKRTQFMILLRRPEYFDQVEIQPGGYGVKWDDIQTISDEILYKMGKQVPLSPDDFKRFASERIVNTAEAAGILGCSRQYINELVRKGELHPIKATEKNTLFLKSEIIKRDWK